MSDLLIQEGLHFLLLPKTTISTAVSATVTIPVAGKQTGLAGARTAIAQAKFLYGSGGTTVDAYIQTSLDRGVTWVDIMNFNFTTAAATKISKVDSATALTAVTVPSDGALTSNTIKDGLLGDQFRLKWVTTGTYAGATSLQVDLIIKG